MKVYIIRHGESETNKNSLWTGWTDAHLTELGKKQAQSIAGLLKTDFDKIFSSDLIRAKETAENAIERCHYETSPLLREINVGTLAMSPISLISPEQKDDISKNGYVSFEGESQEEFKKRVTDFKKKLEELNCENVAVFTHNNWLRTFFNEALSIKVPRGKVICKNCTVAIFEYENNEWKLYSWINSN